MKLKTCLKNALTLAAIAAFCLGTQSPSIAAPGARELDLDDPQVRAVISIQERVTPNLINIPGVLATAVSADEDGTPVLAIYVDRESPSANEFAKGFGSGIGGIGVRVKQTEKFQAYGNTTKLTPPIKLGTSGGWSYDLANGYCCGGTLGGLIQVNGTQYILSNYHVLESDIVTGGNGVVANTGDPVIQPGLIDIGCSSGTAQSVGTLVKLSSLPGSNVDVAVARVAPGMVDTSGAILGIGTLSRNTLAAKLNQAVKKSGRSTGLTVSSISGLNATVNVTFSNECAGGTAFTKTFTGQILVANSNNSFLASGDSGSLLVENAATNPRTVGLLFAANSTSAIANPISQVLTYVGGKLGGTATVVGK